MSINVETGWKIWACEPGKFGFRLPLPLLHTPFNSSWCYNIIININEDAVMGLSADSATKNSDLGILGDFWGDGADSAQKMDTLAGRRVSSSPGKRRGHDPPLRMIKGSMPGRVGQNRVYAQ